MGFKDKLKKVKTKAHNAYAKVHEALDSASDWLDEKDSKVAEEAHNLDQLGKILTGRADPSGLSVSKKEKKIEDKLVDLIDDIYNESKENNAKSYVEKLVYYIILNQKSWAKKGASNKEISKIRAKKFKEAYAAWLKNYDVSLTDNFKKIKKVLLVELESESNAFKGLGIDMQKIKTKIEEYESNKRKKRSNFSELTERLKTINI